RTADDHIVHHIRISTDGEINVAVKSGELVCRRPISDFWKACSMDDLLREFLTETSESLDTVDNQLVRFKQDPSDGKIRDKIFRLVHTIKGNGGFLGLPRLEEMANAGETPMATCRHARRVKAE